MRTTWSFHTAGQLVFGEGAAAQLGSLCQHAKLDRVLIVTDKTLLEHGLVERVHRSLAESKLEVSVFDGGQAEPPIDVACRAIECAKEFRPAGILGLGGGSNMDVSKFVATVMAHGGEPSDYFGVDRIPAAVLPLVCVPTTAGTGSEVSHAAVLTDTSKEMKVSMLSNRLRPSLAVVDPELTYSCPPQVTADSGIDALTHAIEACTAVDYHALSAEQATAYEGRFPLGERIAEEAIRLIHEHLVVAVRDGADRTARQGMALASTLAGMAFSNCGVALVHALEYPLGGALHCSHGAGNGLLLPFVMRFNLPARKTTFARIASLMGQDTLAMSEDEAAEAAVAAVAKLKTDIGIPERIRELGGLPEQLPGFAKKAFVLERLRQINPRAATEEDLLSIYENAF